MFLQETTEVQSSQVQRATEEWMVICQHSTDRNVQPEVRLQKDFDWTTNSLCYPNIEEASSFITRQRKEATAHVFSTSANPENLQGKQLQVYNTVKSHYEGNCTEPLHMIISGTAGTGKSYLIHCLRLLLKDQLYVAAPTGVAAFNVQGYTLDSLLHLPTKGSSKS